MSKTQRTVKGRKMNENEAPRRMRDGGHLVLTPPTREALTQGVSVAAWVGIAALGIGLLTTIPLGRRASAPSGADERVVEAES